ncbi:MotA/TolQ/ExbB proton channel family protein [Clostridium sp. D53t1_180928_C8]|uniref:motility protein A n=1 Tax=Clostridium sp. D53t1_180928_C8 TaxID=2787101 RepID=UPI0018ABC2DE|nr:MotA/TolQ/ExbB proton channel family protein [Clostridium sp. D53t1_180928_C8]
MKRNDILTPIGILLGISFIIFAISQGNVGVKRFYDLVSIMITVGGSFSALLITYSIDEIMMFIFMTKKLFRTSSISKGDVIKEFKKISIKSRKDGFLAIESNIQEIKDDFMKTGLELVVDGVEADLIVDILNSNISEVENRYSKAGKIYKTWGSYAPAFGMIGTLVGLIQMLSQLDNPDTIASGMAAALITTFYGALLANLILNPLGFNLENKGEREAENREMMLVGILSIKNGDSTRILEEKLASFLNEKEKVKYLKGGNVNGSEKKAA